MNMISKVINSFNHTITDPKDFPKSRAPVDFVAAITTGIIRGYKRIGSKISLVLKEADMAESNVPRATNPNVPIVDIRNISGIF